VTSAVKLEIAVRKAAAINILEVKCFWCEVFDGIKIAQEAFPPHTRCDTIPCLSTDLSIVRNVSISGKVATNMLMNLEEVSHYPRLSTFCFQASTRPEQSLLYSALIELKSASKYYRKVTLAPRDDVYFVDCSCSLTYLNW
jgi:hypothetical protein